MAVTILRWSKSSVSLTTNFAFDNFDRCFGRRSWPVTCLRSLSHYETKLVISDLCHCKYWLRLLRMHRGLGSRFCDRYEVTHALIQKLTNLVSNETLKTQKSRFVIIFGKFWCLIGEISIWRWKSPSFENSMFFDKKNQITNCKEIYVNNLILQNGILK